MSTLTAPSSAAATAQLLTENWLRNVFSCNLYKVEGRAAGEVDSDHPMAIVVTHAHPTDEGGRVPLLVVEVSDMPVAEYPAEEASRFAAAGVRDYWVIEVTARRLHVYRDPRPDPDTKHGHSYKQVRVYSPNARFAAGRGTSSGPGRQFAAVVGESGGTLGVSPTLKATRAKPPMTEADWLTGTDFSAHVRLAIDHLSPRRQRLLAAGFCRAVSPFFDHPDLMQALLIIERHADGRADAVDIERARNRCREIAQEAYEAYRGKSMAAMKPGFGGARWRFPIVSSMSGLGAWHLPQRPPCPWTWWGSGQPMRQYKHAPRAWRSYRLPPPSWTARGSNSPASCAAWCGKSPAIPSGWFTSLPTGEPTPRRQSRGRCTILRDFSAMPVLADALQDAGCDNDDVLSHCRDATANHVRGCWVVDVTLARS